MGENMQEVYDTVVQETLDVLKTRKRGVVVERVWEGAIYAEMSADSGGCMDLNHNNGAQKCHAHFCDGDISEIIACNADGTGCDAKWKIENILQLIPNPCPGVIPNCTKMAEVEDDLGIYPHREDPESTQTGENGAALYELTKTLCTDADEFEVSLSCQWKGFVVSFSYDCPCGAKCEVEDREFMYRVMCPRCSTIYVCNMFFKVTKHEA